MAPKKGKPTGGKIGYIPKNTFAPLTKVSTYIEQYSSLLYNVLKYIPVLLVNLFKNKQSMTKPRIDRLVYVEKNNTLTIMGDGFLSSSTVAVTDNRGMQYTSEITTATPTSLVVSLIKKNSHTYDDALLVTVASNQEITTSNLLITHSSVLPET